MARSTSTTKPEVTATEGAAPVAPPTPETKNPLPQSDHRSAETPGVRTEAEVIAAEQDTADRAAAAAARPGAGSPLAVRDRAVEDRDTLVHFLRERDGTVQSVNPGTPEHGVLLSDPEFTETTETVAKAYEPRRFVAVPKPDYRRA